MISSALCGGSSFVSLLNASVGFTSIFMSQRLCRRLRELLPAVKALHKSTWCELLHCNWMSYGCTGPKVPLHSSAFHTFIQSCGLWDPTDRRQHRCWTIATSAHDNKVQVTMVKSTHTHGNTRRCLCPAPCLVSTIGSFFVISAIVINKFQFQHHGPCISLSCSVLSSIGHSSFWESMKIETENKDTSTWCISRLDYGKI